MNLREIEKEIASLEKADASWQTIQRLATLYVVFDHLTENDIEPEIRDTMPDYAGECGEAISGAPIDKVVEILTEHFSVIKILHPKEYQAVLDRLAGAPR